MNIRVFPTNITISRSFRLGIRLPLLYIYTMGVPCLIVMYLSVGHLNYLNSTNCETDCLLKLWLHPIVPEHKAIISYIRMNVLDPPQEYVPDPPTEIEVQDPPWKEIGNWHLIQDVIRFLFDNRHNGTFVEVGAGDGVFLSHTSWLETKRGWGGLLLEPRQEAYNKIRGRRKAASAQVCVSNSSHNKKVKMWSPFVNEDMPELYHRVADAKTTLLQYVAQEDHEHGKIWWSQCYTLNALIKASLGNRSSFDLLVIHTMGGEGDILDTLEDVQMVMLIARYHTDIDKKSTMEKAERLNMVRYNETHPGLDNFLFFLHKNIKLIERKRS